MQSMTPSAHRRAQMERERREREAREMSEHTWLKCAAGRTSGLNDPRHSTARWPICNMVENIRD
jgi:hypothetical protein